MLVYFIPGVGVAQLGGYLFAVGGHDGSNYLNSVEAYNPISDRCATVPVILSLPYLTHQYH